MSDKIKFGEMNKKITDFRTAVPSDIINISLIFDINFSDPSKISFWPTNPDSIAGNVIIIFIANIIIFNRIFGKFVRYSRGIYSSAVDFSPHIKKVAIMAIIKALTKLFFMFLSPKK